MHTRQKKYVILVKRISVSILGMKSLIFLVSENHIFVLCSLKIIDNHMISNAIWNNEPVWRVQFIV